MRMNKLSTIISAAALITFGTPSWAADLEVPNTFSPNTTISSSQMNANFTAVQNKVNAIMANTEGSALKTEVDKIQGIINNTQAGTLKTQVDKISGLETDVNSLKQNVATGSCGTGMTRVGPTCVDNTRGPANTSWLNAVTACRTAGKRLLTPGEWVAAKQQGALDAEDDKLEWVDAVNQNNTNGENYQMYVGYMGTTADLGGGIAFFNNQLSTATFANIYYRCAR